MPNKGKIYLLQFNPRLPRSIFLVNSFLNDVFSHYFPWFILCNNEMLSFVYSKFGRSQTKKETISLQETDVINISLNV